MFPLDYMAEMISLFTVLAFHKILVVEDVYNDSSLIQMKGVGFSRNYEFHYYCMKEQFMTKVGFSPLNLSSLSLSDNIVIPGSV